MALRDVNRLSGKIYYTIRNEDDYSKGIYLTNPSISNDYIFFRRIVIDMYKSGVAIQDRHTGILKIIDISVHFPILKYLEDLRIFDYNNSIWFIGFKRNDKDIWESYLCEFDSKCDYVNHIHHIFRSDNNIKNVVPLVDVSTNRLYMLDICAATVYEYSTMSKDVSIVNSIDMSLKQNLFPKSNIYGSTQYLSLYNKDENNDTNNDTNNKNLYGAIVHDLYMVYGERYYLHHWVEIDISQWKIVYMSKPFLLAFFGIEFASGITWDNDSNMFKIYFGLKNARSYYTTCTLQDLRQGGIDVGPNLD